MNKPIFEHTYNGVLFKIYDNGIVKQEKSPYPKDAIIVINRIHQKISEINETYK